MICEVCNKRLATQHHHKFPQYKRYRKLYREFIDHPDNLIPVCADCHMVKSLPRWTEREFCEHFKIEIRSKSGRAA